MLVLADELWLDLPAMFPAWPTLISNGLLPVVMTLAGMVAIYLIFREFGNANRSEAIVGLFVFLVVSFILLTIVGVFFRGANMALVMPWAL